MTKQISMTAVLATLCVVALVLGGLAGYAFHPDKETVLVDKPVPYEVVKEVVKEVQVPGANITKEVTVSDLDKAVATFLKAAEAEEDEAGNEVDVLNGYDFKDISVSKVSSDYNAEYTKDTSVVNFEITLKYKEAGTDERSEKVSYDVTVTYETDEDTVVEVSEVE